MDAARWQRLKPWLDRLLDAEDDVARAALLAALPDADRELRDELEALLREHAAAATLDHGAAALAAPLLAPELLSQELEGERVGQLVGHYRLKRLLGSGGMGAVYLAERHQDGFVQRVALKIVRTTLRGASARARFDRERRILAELKHPNIAQLFDGGSTDDGAPYYTMELVDGVPISDYCRDHGGDPVLAVRLMLKVASALAHAHQRLIVHRDIKPSNILVTAEQHVKLLDFGIAKPMFVAAGDSLTRGTIGPMTPEYAAPEQFRGGAVTAATDIYQFGVLLYRLLTGRLPYDADPADALGWARAVTEQEPIALARAFALAQQRSRDIATDATSLPTPAMRRLRRWLSGDLDAIVQMTLAKRADDRYRSMDALIADLEAFQRDEPVSARRAGAADRLRRFVVRHRLVVSLAALSALALLATTAYALLEAARARDEAARANAAMEFVDDMFRRLDPVQGGSRELHAEAMLAHAAGRLDRGEITQPALRVRLEQLLGDAYIALGDFAQARTRFAHAVDYLRADPQADPLQLARALERHAWTLYRSGRVEQAIGLVDEAEQRLPPASSASVDVEVAIAAFRIAVERDQGRYAASLPHAEHALALSERFDPPGGSERSTQVRMKLATVYKDLGRYEDAVNEASRARQWLASRYGEEDLRAVQGDALLGWVLTSTERYRDALPLLERAGQRYLQALGAKSPRYTTVLYSLGLLYRRLGELERAHAAFTDIVTAYREVSGESSLELGWALWNLGNLSLDLGRIKAAIQEFEEVDAIWQRSMPELTTVRASVWGDLVRARLLRRDFARARADAARFVVALQAAGGESGEPYLRLLALQAAAAAAAGDEAAAASLRAAAVQAVAKLADEPGERERLDALVAQWAETRPAAETPTLR